MELEKQQFASQQSVRVCERERSTHERPFIRLHMFRSQRRN